MSACNALANYHSEFIYKLPNGFRKINIIQNLSWWHSATIFFFFLGNGVNQMLPGMFDQVLCIDFIYLVKCFAIP